MKRSCRRFDQGPRRRGRHGNCRNRPPAERAAPPGDELNARRPTSDCSASYCNHAHDGSLNGTAGSATNLQYGAIADSHCRFSDCCDTCFRTGHRRSARIASAAGTPPGKSRPTPRAPRRGQQAYGHGPRGCPRCPVPERPVPERGAPKRHARLAGADFRPTGFGHRTGASTGFARNCPRDRCDQPDRTAGTTVRVGTATATAGFREGRNQGGADDSGAPPELCTGSI
jgi:hypothetical protein